MSRAGKSGRIGKLAALFLAAILGMGLFRAPVRAEDHSARMTVKVAVLNNTTYANQDENGVWSGIDVECMIDIARKAGFDVEFIDSSEDPDFMGNLDKGVYDIVADVVLTPEREENYLFTDEVMGATNNTLAVRADDNRWDYGDINQISDMKIGVLSTYANNADFRKWCDKHSIAPQIFEYADTGTMTAALGSGEIDGAVLSSFNGDAYANQLRVILKFLPESYAFAFRKDDVELKNKVDTAISRILSVNVDYFTTLKNKYETQYKNNILPLSSLEKVYITNNPVIGVAVIADDVPYYKKNTDGTDTGIIPDYYALLADWTGLSFRYDVYSTYEEAIAAVNSGGSDVMGMFNNGMISAYQDNFSLTDSVSTVSCILLTNPGADVTGIRHIASLKQTVDSCRYGAEKLFPDAEMAEYSGAKDCFDAIKNGSADAALVGTYSATWLMNQTNSTAYSIVPISDITFDISIATRANEQTLCSILNKGIAATRGSFPSIATKDTLPSNDLNSTISRIPPAITISVVGALVALVIWLTWALIALRRRQKERTAVMASLAETEKQKAIVEETRRHTEERNKFFANISHDMRTPLNAILGFASLAAKDNISEKSRKEYIAKIRTSGALLRDLINDTLTISKANSGKLELNPEPVRARDLFESIIVPIHQSAVKKNIIFTADYEGARDRIILVDALNFEKILLNLLSNAVKFTPEGGHVSVKLYNDPPESENPDSVIIVSDDGVGMSAEFLPRVFEPFTQERQRGYESMGTGLGLSIVKQLVDLMGGTIQVQSELGKGATFTVRLRFEEAEQEPVSILEEPVGERIDLTGRRILLCEDNSLNQEIAVSMLRDAGVEVDTAEDGQRGARMFSESADYYYDAVLMDVRMPVMNGYEATKTIRESGRADARDIPIIAMTADAFADDARKCYEAGMNGHIAKPIDADKMLEVLSAGISRYRKA